MNVSGTVHLHIVPGILREGGKTMLNLLKDESNRSYMLTENGAVTFASSGSFALDFFAAAGALREADEAEIIVRFTRAFAEHPTYALRTLFYARDVRGGLGERRLFRVLLRHLAAYAPAALVKNLPLVPEFGRWDDLLALLGTPAEKGVLRLVHEQLASDLRADEEGAMVSLLAKWLPSVNTSSRAARAQARSLAKLLGMREAEYRRTLVRLRRRIALIENALRTKDYSFDYAKQPSKAMFKYRAAFLRNDAERYGEFLGRVEHGEAELHTGTLYPYEIIRPLSAWGTPELTPEEVRTLDVTWRVLPDYTHGENALVVLDGSGSMYDGGEPLPSSVALSLTVYFAERNTGAFQGHFITFSRSPQLVEIKGADIAEKVRYCKTFCEVANTNLAAVFDLLLKTAVMNSLPQEELPSVLYIITDMEFDACTEDADMTNFERAKELFADVGYELPRIVFWNVQSRSRQQPVKMNEQGVMLVSGCSPSIFSMIVESRITPYAYMEQVLGSERYTGIEA
jgi:hypothetical protein